MKKKKFLNDTWLFNITFYLCDDMKEINKEYESYGGVTWFDEDKCCAHVAISRRDLCLNLVVHELYHVVDDVMDHKCTERHPTHNEPHAYLIGWLMDKAIIFYKDKGLKF